MQIRNSVYIVYQCFHPCFICSYFIFSCLFHACFVLSYSYACFIHVSYFHISYSHTCFMPVSYFHIHMPVSSMFRTFIFHILMPVSCFPCKTKNNLHEKVGSRSLISNNFPSNEISKHGPTTRDLMYNDVSWTHFVHVFMSLSHVFECPCKK